MDMKTPEATGGAAGDTDTNTNAAADTNANVVDTAANAANAATAAAGDTDTNAAAANTGDDAGKKTIEDLKNEVLDLKTQFTKLTSEANENLNNEITEDLDKDNITVEVLNRMISELKETIKQLKAAQEEEAEATLGGSRRKKSKKSKKRKTKKGKKRKTRRKGKRSRKNLRKNSRKSRK